MKRYKEIGSAIAMSAGMLLIGGCASQYYRVTDPVTGQVYYTEKVDMKKSGSATFTDAKTGSMQGPRYTSFEKLTKAKCVDELF